MKRDKARTITQRRVQSAIFFVLDDIWERNPFTSWVPRASSYTYDKRKLHHYDPVPVHRAVAKKRRRRI